MKKHAFLTFSVAYVHFVTIMVCGFLSSPTYVI
jgi:hypothetical protein